MADNMFAGLEVEEGEDVEVQAQEKKKKKKKKKRSKKTREELRKEEMSEAELAKENEEAEKEGGKIAELDKAEMQPLTADQDKKVQELKESILSDSSLPLEDGHIKVWLADTQPFKRFLLARDFNMDASRKLLVDCIKWRHQFKPWSIKVTEIEPCLRGGHMYSPTFDKQGHACVYMRQHTEPDPTPDDVAMKYMMWSFEMAMYKMLRKTDGQRYKMVWFVSNSGYNPKYNRSMKFIKELAHNVQNYYPERLHRCYFFYAPTMFRLFWNVLKPFLDKSTRSKFTFVHGSNAEVERFLSESFDLNDVEDHFFGKKPSDEWEEEEYYKYCVEMEKEMQAYYADRLDEINNPGKKERLEKERLEQEKKEKKAAKSKGKGKNKRKKEKESTGADNA